MTVPPLKDNGRSRLRRARRSSSVVIPRPVDRPVSHGLKRSVEVLIRVSDRVPRPLITEPDLIRCPPTRSPEDARDAEPQRARAARWRCGGGGGGMRGEGGGILTRRDLNPSMNVHLTTTANLRQELMNRLKFSGFTKLLEELAQFFSELKLRLLCRAFDPLLDDVLFMFENDDTYTCMRSGKKFRRISLTA
ncbi:Uncharacterized protein DBV15_06116 [Temnothorax longispinosus]|uniref:Uncharacterized protein n=1 Tax=Temnothorax longispinosus TaxID=300112 RepID=A0A4S2KCY6_9HYME|nr:Uncharacterized protein DBV15_06116 [Temnothorax longispinosus]